MEDRRFRLRPDADVRPDPDSPEHFLLRHPVTNRHARISFEQAAILFYLDGTRDVAGLASAASEHTGSEITPSDVASFVAELDEAGLIDSGGGTAASREPEAALPQSAWHHLEARHARRVEELKGEVAAERERADRELLEAERQRQALEQELKSAESRFEEAQRSAVEERQRLESRIQELQRELLAALERADTDNRDSEQQQVVLRGELRSVESRLEEAQRAAVEERQRLESRIEQLTGEGAAERERADTQLRESERQRVALENELKSAESRLEESRRAAREERAELESRFEELERRLQSTEEELAARAEALRDAETRIEELLASRAALAEAEAKLSKIRHEKLDLSAAADLRVRELEERIEGLQEAVRQLEAQVAAGDREPAGTGTLQDRAAASPGADTSELEKARLRLAEEDFAPLNFLEEQAQRFQQLLSEAVSRLQRDADVRPRLESDTPSKSDDES